MADNMPMIRVNMALIRYMRGIGTYEEYIAKSMYEFLTTDNAILKMAIICKVYSYDGTDIRALEMVLGEQNENIPAHIPQLGYAYVGMV